MTILSPIHSRSISVLPRYNHSASCLRNLLLLFIYWLPYATAQTRNVPAQPSYEPDPFSTYGSKFNPSMAIIMVVLVSAFFFMGFFSIYIRQCAERRINRNLNTDAVAGGGLRSRSVARGLDTAVIEAFPTFVYSSVKGLKIGKGSLECAVCLNEFEDSEMLRFIPKCSHVFHPDCIGVWLASHTTCPVCRANLVPKPGEITPHVAVFDPNIDPGESDHRLETQNEGLDTVTNEDRSGLGSADVNFMSQSLLANQNRPPRSRSTGWRTSRLFPRSHSTGHSLIQPGEDCERFTLRLPEKVRNQIVNSNLNRSKSCVAFPRARSSRTTYRSGSGGIGRVRNYFYYERFDREVRPERWMLTKGPSFFRRIGSLRSPKAAGVTQVTTPPPKEFIKSPTNKISGEHSDSLV